MMNLMVSVEKTHKCEELDKFLSEIEEAEFEFIEKTNRVLETVEKSTSA